MLPESRLAPTRRLLVLHFIAQFRFLLILLFGAHAIAAPVPAQQPSGIPRTSSFVSTPDGVLLHYVDSSEPATIAIEMPGLNQSTRSVPSSPAVLFIPGWTMTVDIWEKQYAYFSRTRRVVVLDPRAQGDSTSTSDGLFPAARGKDIKTVIDQLHLAPVVLVGWSLAVTEIASYVDQFGTSDLAGIVLVDGTAGMDLTPDLAKQFMTILDRVNKDRVNFTREFVKSMYARPQSDAYIQRVVDDSLSTPTSAAIALSVSGFATDNRAALAKFNKPTLIITRPGAALASYQDMQNRIPGARLEVMQNVGHALFVDDPDRFNSLLDHFLSSVGAQPLAH